VEVTSRARKRQRNDARRDVEGILGWKMVKAKPREKIQIGVMMGEGK